MSVILQPIVINAPVSIGMIPGAVEVDNAALNAAIATSPATTRGALGLGSAALAAASAFQPTDATLTEFAALVTAANKLVYATGEDTFALADFTAAARTLLAATDAAGQRAVIGLVIGTDVLAPSGNGSALTALNPSALGTGTGAVGITAGGTAQDITLTPSTTGKVKCPGGGPTSPGITFGGSSTSGFGGSGSAIFGIFGEVRGLFLTNGYIFGGSTAMFGWTSSADAASTRDTAISRISANVVGVGNGTPGDFSGSLKLAQIILDKTITAGGTTGAQTINKSAGSVNFAAAATSLVVTNPLVTANSVIQCGVATNDTTMKSVAVVAGAGSFTIYPDVAPTAETRVYFLVTN